MKSMKLILLALALTVATAGSAFSQVSISDSKSGTGAVGIMMTVWNAVDSTIVDGSVVMTDTTTASTRPVVRNFLGVALDRGRCVGIAVGSIPKKSANTPGKILIWGYHPRALVGASNIGAKTALKVGLISGSFASAADSVSMQCGYLIGNNLTVLSGTRYSAKIWFFGGAKHTFTL